MLKIDDAKKELIDDNNGEITVIQKFLSEEVLKDPKNKLYLYVDDANNQTEFFGKFGKAIQETIYNRYHSTGQKQNQKMVAVWESALGDEVIHTELKKRAHLLRGYTYEEDYSKTASDEAYRIYSKEGLENLIADITDLAKGEIKLEKAFRPDFPDVEKVVDEVITIQDRPVLEDLCVRFGKTGEHLLLYKRLEATEGIKINIIGSYVGTVKTSYSEEINIYKNNEHCLFIDVDDDLEANYKKIIKHTKTPGNYVVIYLPLTGDEDTCYARRIKLIRKLKSFVMTMTIEESDFGAKCPKQIKKIYSLVKSIEYHFKHFYVTTGTNADNWIDTLGPDVYIIRRDYITDILGVRKEATNIVWNVLDNRNMVVKFGYSINEMENWDDILEIDETGHLKNEAYVREALTYLLRYSLPTIAVSKDSRDLIKTKVLNDNAATMIFTARGNDKHKALKALIDIYFPEYSSIILDGNYTTNTDAEKATKQLIKAHFEKYHNYNIVIIASDMATRSFSVKQIKNVILMCNSGNPIQKIARGLTYWAEYPEIPCRIADFRLDYYDNNLNSYLGSIAINSLASNATHKSIEALTKVLEERIATDKLTFNEYFALGQNPIRPITADELKYHMNSNDGYRRNLSSKILNSCITEVDLPREGFELPEETIDLSGVVNSNLKGDTGRKVKVVTKKNNQDNKNEEEETQIDPRQLYLNYLLNHKEEFNSCLYETDVLKHEFQNNMSAARKQILELALNIDMNVICQIANLLIKHGIDIYN